MKLFTKLKKIIINKFKSLTKTNNVNKTDNNSYFLNNYINEKDDSNYCWKYYINEPKFISNRFPDKVLDKNLNFLSYYSLRTFDINQLYFT